MTTSYSTNWMRGGAGLLAGAMTGGLIWTALMMVPMLLGADWPRRFSINIADATGTLVMLTLTYPLTFVASLLVLSVVVAPIWLVTQRILGNGPWTAVGLGAVLAAGVGCGLWIPSPYVTLIPPFAKDPAVNLLSTIVAPAVVGAIVALVSWLVAYRRGERSTVGT